MFAALLEGPVVIVTRDNYPVVATSWMTPMPDLLDVEQILVTAATDSRWRSVAILDVGDLLPAPEVDETEVRKQWFHRPDWHTRAACRGQGDADRYFFGVDDEKRPALSGTGVRAARDLCRSCPVIADCLEWALTRDERFGIWGGTTGRDRIGMRRQLKAGLTSIEELVRNGIEEHAGQEGPSQEGPGQEDGRQEGCP